MLNKRLWLITKVAQAIVARRYKLRNCKGVVICGSFSQRYVFGETMLHSGKKSHKQRVHENYIQKLLSRYKMNLCDVALSVEHTASPGMCALEGDGIRPVTRGVHGMRSHLPHRPQRSTFSYSMSKPSSTVG